MPIPILKGLRRAGPQADTSRNNLTTTGVTTKTPSPRSKLRSTATVGATPTSHIPSPHGAKVGRGSPSAIKQGRGGVSKVAVQSPRPPPRNSSVSSASSSKIYSVKVIPDNNVPKLAYIKRNEPLSECSGNTNNLTPPSTTSSNRSSVISNSSSIPAPSSSSSNRNSNSSISSNFSISSWNSNGGVNNEVNDDKPYLGSGSGTFPRASGTRRNLVCGSLTNSVNDDNDNKITSRNSLQRPAYKYKSKEITKNGSKSSSAVTSSALSSSESSISHPRVASSAPLNNSDSNLLRQVPETRFSNPRYNSKPTAAVRGVSKPSNNCNISISQSKNKTISQGNNKTNNKEEQSSVKTRSQQVTEGYSVITFASRNYKLKTRNTLNAQSKRKEDNCVPTKEAKKDNKTLDIPYSTDEDDGYSSVANIDHHDEEVKCEETSSSTVQSGGEDDYDEVADIEPMKPLEGISRYSYLQNVDSSKRLSFEEKDCVSKGQQGMSNESAVTEINRSEMWRDSSKDSSQNRETSHSSNVQSFPFPSELTLSTNVGKEDCNASVKLESPRFAKPTTPVSRLPPSKGNKICRSGKPFNDPPGKEVCVGIRSPQISKQLESTSSKTLELGTCERSASTLDDSVLNISYKNFVNIKDKSDTKDGYNWMVRNTIAGSIPATSQANRKFGLSGEASPPSSYTCPSLPLLSSNRVSESCSKSIPTPRPSSLTSPGKIGFGRGNFSDSSLSPHFYRSSSLRSPKDDSVAVLPEKKNNVRLLGLPTSTSSSLNPSPTSSYPTFVRNSPKYSTVIPRTLKEATLTQSELPSYSFPPNSFNRGKSLKPSSPDARGTTVSESNQSDEVLLLKKELKGAQEKVMSLTEQLNSSNKLVAAYEHSLSNMTQRLQQLSKVTEQKDSETIELRRLLEKSCLDGSGMDSRGNSLKRQATRCSSIESLTSLSSSNSVSSAISSSSALSFVSNSSSVDHDGKEKSSLKKKSWLRSSFSKAFKRREKRKRSEILQPDEFRKIPCTRDSVDGMWSQTISDSEIGRGYFSLPSSPLPHRFQQQRHDDVFCDRENTDQSILQICALKEEIARLKKALREKESSLTESRLESLSFAHQMESLKESVHHLSSELSSLKMDREHPEDRYSSFGGLTAFDYNDKREALRSPLPNRFKVRESLSLSQTAAIVNHGKSVKIFVQKLLDIGKAAHNSEDKSTKLFYLGTLSISSTTSWEELDRLINEIFEGHLKYLDPESKLGLDRDSILNYQLGEVKRIPMLEHPELLPYGYLVGDVSSVNITLQTPSLNSIDSMAFEMLYCKTQLLRYITLLKEHRRIVIAGPEGVGKSFLAHRLAEFVVQRLGIEPSSGNIAKFLVKEEAPQDLSVYLSQLSDLCEAKSSDLPLVIILESLENVDKLTEILCASLRVTHDQCPFIIGTMRHCMKRSSEIFKLHPSFRCITLDPNLEPVSNILPRLCRRSLQLVKTHPEMGTENLEPLLEWLPRCWHFINKVLRSSSIVEALGPGILLPFPSSLGDAQMWFFRIWKACLLPKLQKAAESVPQLPKYLESWQELDKCLSEELPWSPSTSGVSLCGIISKESKDASYLT